MEWIILDKRTDSIVATSRDGEDWAFNDEEFKAEFETLIIEGIPVGRKNYVPGDAKFDELFWEEVDKRGYEAKPVEASLVPMAAPSITEGSVMPKALVDKLPARAREIYEEAYDNALKDGDEEKAARVAITAVKNAGYKKDEESDEWTKMEAIPMHFTKASLDSKTGEMRWSATVSKFEEDDQGDEVTAEFYKSAIASVERGVRPMPVLCVSHIDKGAPTDSWVAGDTASMFVDGDRPKAKGTFRDTPLGQAAFEAVRKDMQEELPDDERARISMGFYDEGSVSKGKDSGRTFISGWIKHFAVTRVPVVKEAEIEAKGELMPTAREDAASIVGDELAESLLEGSTEDKSLIAKKDEGGRADQVKGLVDQLMELLQDTEAEDIDVEGLRAALGNRGTNVPESEKADKAEFEERVNQLVDGFGDHVKSALLGTGDRTEKFQAVQQGLDQFGEGVERLVKGYTPPSGQDISDTVQKAVQAAVGPLQQELVNLRAQIEAGGMAQPTTVAQPRSMDGRVQMTTPPVPTTGMPPWQGALQKKARTARELAWESTAIPTKGY